MDKYFVRLKGRDARGITFIVSKSEEVVSSKVFYFLSDTLVLGDWKLMLAGIFL